MRPPTGRKSSGEGHGRQKRVVQRSAAAFFMKFITDGDRETFFCGAAVFILVYAVSLLIILPDNEKSAVIKFFKKIRLSTGLRKN